MKTTAHKRAVTCATCGQAFKRTHQCDADLTGDDIEEHRLLDEIRSLRAPNKRHVDSLKRRGRIGTHPTRP